MSDIITERQSKTVLNSNTMPQSAETVFNGLTEQDRETVLNVQTNPSGTVINENVHRESVISSGTVLCNTYEVVEKLNVNAGEADLYLCTFATRKYIAKVYRRKIAIKPEVVERLSQIRSPYVARIFAMGEYLGYPVEILPYYPNGSLAGKKYSFDQLKYEIIPTLNEGLHVLHSNGIIHKDVKPSNIMLNNDGRTVAIIDFGISSLRDEGSTVIVTRTGLTPEYSAPETFRNLFLSESDYYSFGVTICELFSGHSPYSGLSQDEIEKFATIQKLPTPPEMNRELVELVNALTYVDISNRHDKSNPNRRWGYEEVDNWCNDIPQVIPGQTPNLNPQLLKGKTSYSVANEPEIQGDMPPYRFGGRAITSTKELAKALNERWDEGKKHLFRGLLLDHFKKDGSNAEIISYLMDFQEESETGNPDVIMFKCLYAIDASLKELLWKGKSYSSLSVFGENYLSAIRSGNKEFLSMVDEMLSSGIFSQYISCVEPSADKQIKALRAVESEYRVTHAVDSKLLAKRYRLAYMISDVKDYAVRSEKFKSVDDFTNYLMESAKQTGNSFEYELRSVVFENGKDFDIQFVCWLQAHGCGSFIDQSNDNKEEVFFELIYKLNPELTSLSWKNVTFVDLKDMGHKYLLALQTNNYSVIEIVEELFTKRLIEIYLINTALDDIVLIDSMKRYEKTVAIDFGPYQPYKRESLSKRYSFAYELSEVKDYAISSEHFNNLDDFTDYLMKSAELNGNSFESELRSAVFENGKDFDIQFVCWLKALGHESIIEQNDDKDTAFFKLIYRLNPYLTSLSWRGMTFNDLKDLGNQYLSILRTNDFLKAKNIEELFTKGLIEIYLELTSLYNVDTKNRMSMISQELQNISNSNSHEAKVCRYSIAYELSGSSEYVYDNEAFSNIDSLVAYIHSSLKTSLDKFNTICNRLISDKGMLNSEFEAWLVLKGKSDALAAWKSGAPFISKQEKRIQIKYTYDTCVEKMGNGKAILLSEREEFYRTLADQFIALGDYEDSIIYAEKCIEEAKQAHDEVLFKQKYKDYCSIVKQLDQWASISQPEREKWYLDLAKALEKYTNEVVEAAGIIEYCRSQAKINRKLTIYNNANRIQTKAKKATGDERKKLFLEAAELFEAVGQEYEAPKYAAMCREAASDSGNECLTKASDNKQKDTVVTDTVDDTERRKKPQNNAIIDTQAIPLKSRELVNKVNKLVDFCKEVRVNAANLLSELQDYESSL